MKHVKEFKLDNTKKVNEGLGYLTEITRESIKNEIISSLIQLYEFTDVLLTKPEVVLEIEEIARNKYREYLDDLDSMASWKSYQDFVKKYDGK